MVYRPLSTRTNHDSGDVKKTTTKTSPPVLIVGGGPSGLFMSLMLQSYNVPFVLLEAQTPQQRFQHPQAHFLNTRTMEILKHTSSEYITISSSILYQRIRDAMPPVEEWKSFIFGPNMTSVEKIMAKVIHPVDRPLVANMDANGRLVKKDSNETDFGANDTSNEQKVPLSEVSVGHLAQHTFCKILYDAVMEAEEKKSTSSTITSAGHNDNSQNQILYGHRVTDYKWDDIQRTWTVKTDQGTTFQSNIIIAADGARSCVRSQILNIPMNGQPVIQNLMNVHFQVSSRIEQQIPPAMLYTVFSSEVLAMIVRHGPGDYVMQIPYFAPYQTPEQDFTTEKVQNYGPSCVRS